MTPAENIREIWQEMKELKRLREADSLADERRVALEYKYGDIETLFGHESTLDKAIIFYINSNSLR